MTRSALLRSLPSVDEVLRREEVRTLAARAAPALLAAWIREMVEDLRRGIQSGLIAEAGALDERVGALPRALEARLEALERPALRRILNASGVIVHTNLGRAPLGDGALDAMAAAGASYTDLEYDVAAGERGSRGAHWEASVGALFPGRAMLAVNNNAAAVLLVLNSLAEGREVVLSRGELVEIGGSFRIPEVMAKAGAVLREVGTTNRTRLADYRSVICERTALLAKVHTSNYRIVGFVEEATIEDLAALGMEKGLPLMVDQGSGYVRSPRAAGAGPGGMPEGGAMHDIPGEPDVGALLRAGANLVTFSGDKLLGGPQAGLIVGDPALVERCARNPLARALRLDKTRVASLAWTLAEHAAGRAGESLPVLAMLARTPEEIGERARHVLESLARAGAPLEGAIEDGTSRVGGGAAPLQDLPTRILALRSAGKSAAALESALRDQDPPVVARIAEGRVLIDLRTVDPLEDDLLARLLAAAARA